MTLERRVRVLVVDDEPDVADALADLLAEDGCETATARNGIEALDRIATAAFDVILTDVRMPRLDGLGLYHRITSFDPILAARVIFFTGHACDEDLKTINEAGRPCLGKPVDIPKLFELVRTLGPRRDGR